MKTKILLQILLTISLVIIANTSYAAGVEDLLVDFSDYLSTRLIPAAGAVGVGIGGIMAGLGSPQGMDVIKYSIIGGVIGTAGAETLTALFF